MQLPNLPLTVPDSSRVDLSYTDTVELTVDTPAGSRVHSATGRLVDVPLTLFVLVTTSAVVADRNLNIVVKDANARGVFQVVAPNAQPASTLWQYAASIQLTTVFSSSQGSVSLPLPPVALVPGWSITVQVAGVQAGDVIGRCVWTMQRIPTGPPHALAEPLPVPIAV